MSDAVRHPGHYSGDGRVECMDAMRSMMGAEGLEVTPVQSYWWGCALKYLWRWNLKGGRQDLEKAKRCIGYLEAELG